MKFTKFFTVFAVALLVLTGVMGAGAPVAAQDAKFDIKPIIQNYLTTLPQGFSGIGPADTLKALQGDPKPYLIDIRDEKDFKDGGYIEGAVNIPLPMLTQSLDKLPAQDSPIIVYCGIGHRGGIALVTLQLLGYTNVKSISGGFANWKNNKLPVAQGVPPAAEVTGAKAPEFDPELFKVLDAFITNLPSDYYVVAPTAALQSFQKTPKPFILDVREPKELTDKGYIEGMVNIPLRTVYDNLDKLPAEMDAPIVVYCAVGHRGSIGMTSLLLLGYTNVKSIAGGFNGWVAAGLPIVEPAPVATEEATPAK